MMEKAFVFAGQGAQYSGMGRDLYESGGVPRTLFEKADDLLGFQISKIMFDGSEEELKETSITQPALYIHAIAQYKSRNNNSIPAAVAGHSLGEFSALAASGVLSFEDGLELVKTRADAMKEACDAIPGTMAAIIGLDDHIVEDICNSIEGIVVPANYNCPGQLVISGEINAVNEACEMLRDRGARRALILNVGGAFHSPLMLSAKQKLQMKIEEMKFNEPVCPIYQNVTATGVRDPQVIKRNLIDQLTGPVKWTQSIEKMISDRITIFSEFGGNGKVLSGLIRKISRDVTIEPL